MEESLNEKLWTKDFILITLINFLMYIIHYALIVTITIFTIEKYQASEGMGGLAAGIFIIGMVLGRLYGGKYIDNLQPKYVLLTGLIASVITIALYFTIQSLLILMIVRFLHGIAFGLSSTSTGAIASKIVPEARKGAGIGYYALSTTVASAVGPFIGILINDQLGYSMNFAFCLSIIIVGLILSLIVGKIPVASVPEEHVEPEVKGISKFLEKESLPIAFVAVFGGIGFASVLSFLTAYTEMINLSSAASFFFVVYAVTTLVSRPFTGRIFDNYGENKVMYPTLVCFVIGLVMLGMTTNSLMLLVSAVFIGLGYGTLIPTAQAIAVKSAPKERIGLATSTFYMLADLGAGFAPFILGLLIPILGYRNLYVTLAVMLILVIGLYYVVHGKKAKKRRSAEI